MAKKTKINKKNLKKVQQPVAEAQTNVQIITFEQAILRMLGTQQASIDAVRVDVAVIKAALFEE